MSTETIHPMVMKAALSLRNSRADATGSSREQVWHYEKEKLIADAQAALTECGALECLEALEALLRYCVDDDGQPTVAMARSIIANARDVSSAGSVYGSAPE